MNNKLPVVNWHKIIKETRSEAEKPLSVAVAGDASAIDKLHSILGEGSKLLFPAAGDAVSTTPVDLLVIALSAGAPIGEEAREAASKAIISGGEVIALIDEGELNPSMRLNRQVDAEISLNLSPGGIIYFSSKMNPREKNSLLSTILERVGEKSLTLAAKVPVFRSLVVRQIINEVAGQNGIIAVASFIPAADMPVLTGNQIRMVLKIAAAFGVTVNFRRVRELLVVVGGGFTFRALARELVGFVPVAGWAVKGAVAYTGTRAVGELAAKYFSGLEAGE